MTALYQELRKRAIEELQEESISLQNHLIDYAEKLVQAVPYMLDYNDAPDWNGILKLLDVRISSDAESLVEKLIEYIRMHHRLCHIDVFWITNIKQYLSQNELESLSQFSFYEKVHLILLESDEKYRISSEKMLVIDQDGCIIEMN